MQSSLGAIIVAEISEWWVALRRNIYTASHAQACGKQMGKNS